MEIKRITPEEAKQLLDSKKGYLYVDVRSVQEVFDRWDLHQVELWTLGDNDRALRTYGRCGFVEEARLRDRSWKDGRWVDHVVMSVGRDEFGTVRDGWPGRLGGS